MRDPRLDEDLDHTVRQTISRGRADKQQKATQTVLEQAALLSGEWAA